MDNQEKQFQRVVLKGLLSCMLASVTILLDEDYDEETSEISKNDVAEQITMSAAEIKAYDKKYLND